MTLSDASSLRASRSTSKSTERNKIAAGLERGPPFSFAPGTGMLSGMDGDAQTLEREADRAAAAGQVATAAQLLERAVEAGGQNPALWIKLSAMRQASADIRGALAAIDKALELQPLD